jgi:hypothetical protein
MIFSDPLHDEFSRWPLAYTSTGGIELGEVIAISAAVDTAGGGDDAFFDAWFAAGERARVEGVAALDRGHDESGKALLLRAAALFATSYKPLFGFPVDPRLLHAYQSQISAFERALEVGEHPVRRLGIPFEGDVLPGYLVPAAGHENEVRPLIVFTNGYDGTVTDLYFANAAAASRRGYHALIFSGPGQDEMLFRRGTTLRPDWEVVVSAVLDHALGLPIVDPDQMVLSGWSLGGYLAPRAAAGESRLRALIADPGQLDLGAAVRGFLARFGVDADISGFTAADIPDSTVATIDAAIRADRALRWRFVQRGFWANGVIDLRGFIDATLAFTLRDRVHRITCATLIVAAELDPLAAQARELFDLLCCEKDFLLFTATEGAGGHCEMGNRSLFNLRSLDWLDDQLSSNSAAGISLAESRA